MSQSTKEKSFRLIVDPEGKTRELVDTAPDVAVSVLVRPGEGDEVTLIGDGGKFRESVTRKPRESLREAADRVLCEFGRRGRFKRRR